MGRWLVGAELRPRCVPTRLRPCEFGGQVSSLYAPQTTVARFWPSVTNGYPAGICHRRRLRHQA